MVARWRLAAITRPAGRAGADRALWGLTLSALSTALRWRSTLNAERTYAETSGIARVRAPPDPGHRSGADQAGGQRRSGGRHPRAVPGDSRAGDSRGGDARCAGPRHADRAQGGAAVQRAG